jgi:hypothetical protein
MAAAITSSTLAPIAAPTLAFEARDRYASIERTRNAIAVAQRRRLPTHAIELGASVRGSPQLEPAHGISGGGSARSSSPDRSFQGAATCTGNDRSGAPVDGA